MKIRQIATYRPSRLISSHDIDTSLNLKKGTALKLSGVHTRHWTSPEETIAPSDLDALIYTGASHAQPVPCTAALIQQAAGHQKYSCFDIDATCLGFLKALEIAHLYLASGTYQRLVIVVSECASKGLNPKSPKSYSLFGDGAVAYLLDRDQGLSIKHLGAHFATYGQFASECQILGGGSHLPGYQHCAENHDQFLFEMNGRKLYLEAARLLPPHLDTFLKKQNLTLSDIDWVVPHQASRTAMALLAKRLKIPKQKVINILADHGNQIAASIPIALHHLLTQREVLPGQKIILIGTGAGLGLGTTLLEIAK
jgi:3-oxoacyl-[acyl-carrier-protein] synthase-3